MQLLLFVMSEIVKRKCQLGLVLFLIPADVHKYIPEKARTGREVINQVC